MSAPIESASDAVTRILRDGLPDRMYREQLAELLRRIRNDHGNRLSALGEQLEQAQRRADTLAEQLELIQREAPKERSSTERERTALLAHVGGLESERDRLTAENLKLSNEVTALVAELTECRKELAEGRTEHDATRPRPDRPDRVRKADR